MRRSFICLTSVAMALLACAGTWVLPGKGQHGSFAPVVSFIGTQFQHLGAATGTTVTPGTTVDVQAGDLVLFLFGAGQSVSQNYTASSSPSVGTFTEIFEAFDDLNDYQNGFYALVATSTQTGVTFTGNVVTSAAFRYAHVAVFRTSAGTFSIGQTTRNTSAPEPAATSTSRTAVNLTTTVANTLLVAMGVDFAGGVTHTAANAYTLSADGLVSYLYWKQVSATGTHPNGNFGTVNSTDQYWSFFLEASISP